MSLLPPTPDQTATRSEPQADTPEVRTSAPRPEPPFDYRESCQCDPCREYTARLAAWEAAQPKTEAKGGGPKADTKACDCPACRIKKALQNAFPNARVEPIAAFAAAPGPLSEPADEQTAVAGKMTKLLRDVRDLTSRPSLKRLGLDDPADATSCAARDQLLNGAADAIDGLMRAAGAVAVLGAMRAGDAFEEMAARR